jgi:hypothetical protein
MRGIGAVDDSNFLIIAKWIQSGFRPYLDLMEIKPPGIYYTLYLLKIFFGEAWWVSRVFILFVDLALVSLVFLVTMKQKGWLAGLFAAIFLYPSMMLFRAYCLLTESFCALFGIIALAVIYRRETVSLRRTFTFGACVGFSVLYKQPGILYLLAYLFFLLISIVCSKLTIKRALVLALFAIAGFLCVWSVILFLLYKSGMLKGFIYYALIFPTQFGSFAGYPELMLRFLATPIFWVIAASILLIIKNRKLSIRGLLEKNDLFLWCMFLFSLAPLCLRPSFHYILASLFIIIMLIGSLWAKIIIYILVKKKSFLESQSSVRRFLVKLLVVSPILPTILAMSCMSWFFLREQRLEIDRLQTYELGSKIIKFSPDSNEPILCLPVASSRIYYMLERRPYPGYLIMFLNGPQWEERYKEVLGIIENGVVPVVIIEDNLDPANSFFNTSILRKLLDSIEKRYRQIPLHFAVDKSRGRKIVLYILNERVPVQRDFRSHIFPEKPSYRQSVSD